MGRRSAWMLNLYSCFNKLIPNVIESNFHFSLLFDGGGGLGSE